MSSVRIVGIWLSLSVLSEDEKQELWEVIEEGADVGK